MQTDHLHLIVEALDSKTFSSGMRSLCIRAARAINALFKTRGKVIRDRYHRRDLFSGKQVRDILVYVLLNGAKHKVVPVGALDRFSSSSFFEGWRDVDLTRIETIPHATGDPTPFPVTPWTRMLKRDWRAYGLLSPEESLRWMMPPIHWPD